MNNHNRAQLSAAIDLMQQAEQIVEDIKDDEDCKLENMPDNLLESPAAIALEEAINSLDDVDISSAVDSITEAMGG